MLKEKEMQERLNETLAYLESYAQKPIDIAIVAGSGLGKFADLIEKKEEVSYELIPHFVKSSVAGHAGKLIFGEVAGKSVVLMAGRVHFYEGYSMQEITYPIRVFQALNIPRILLTNAAGGLQQEFADGAIMIISDHINLMGDSPLVGQNLADYGVRFPGMNDAYNAEARLCLHKIAAEHHITVHEGVYAGWKGPAYETPAEIRYIKTIGADAVGMSTVPEVLVAIHGGMKVVAMSCITNMAAGLSDTSPNHEEVMAMADKLSDDMCTLTKAYIASL
jgi:purine-nucleoside phosphorylase